MSLNFVKRVPFINGDYDTDTPQLQFFTRGFYLNGSYSPTYQDVTVSGNDYVNLPNAKANGLNYLKLYGGCEQSGTGDPSPSNIRPIVCNNGEIKSPNLFDVDTMSSIKKISLATTYGQDKIYYSNASSSVVMPCLANTDYIISLGGELQGTIFRVATTERLLTTSDGSSNPYTACAINRNPVNNTLTINSGAGAKYMYIQFGGSVINSMLLILQVQKGTTATPYRAFGQIYVDGTTETIKDSLNNTATAQNLLAIGTKSDVQEVLTGAITRNIGVYVFTGNEDWVYSSDYTRFETDISGFKSSGLRLTKLYCTHFKCISDGRNINSVPNNSIYSGATTLICIKTSLYSTANDWKSYLAQQYVEGTPVILVYPLETPTAETTTPQTLRLQKGSNTIEITQASISPLQLEAQYKAGVEVTITEVQNVNLDNSVTVTIGE